MIRVLGLALYGSLAASTRYRLGQYVEGLARHGIELEIRSLLGNSYLSRTFSGKRPQLSGLIRSGIDRLHDLRRSKEYDLALLHCELFPFLPGALERGAIRCRYVYDFDDAFYLKYRTGRFAFSRSLLGNKFDTVISGAAHVTAGNRQLASYAARNNAATTLLPTVVDMQRYVPLAGRRREDKFTVGWIGSPSTAAYLSEVVEPLRAASRSIPLRLVVIGGRAPLIPGVEVVELDWSEDSEIELINTFHVGIMPLPDSDWARGKCAFKLIQYMACGVPVIASPVGANLDVVTADVGYLARTPDEWEAAIVNFSGDPAKRKQMGLAARARATAHYSLATTLPTLAAVLKSASNT